MSVERTRPNLDVAIDVEPAFGPAEWPIAAGLPQLPGTLADGTRTAEASASVWRRHLAPTAREGFSDIELPTTWVSPSDLTGERQNELFGVIADLGLNAIGISVARSSVIHPTLGEASMELHYRTIDVAAARGIGFVCTGFHEPLTSAQQQALWFWDETRQERRPSDEEFDVAAARIRELGAHAESVGVELALEMYENTVLGSADDALRLLEMIDCPAVGLNPDIGNLIRLNREVEHWERMLAVTLPHANYWHVKNYSRGTIESGVAYATAPVEMKAGLIDYRTALRYAVAHGFSGPLVVEHYGGDGIAMSADNRDYLRRILPVGRD